MLFSKRNARRRRRSEWCLSSTCAAPARILSSGPEILEERRVLSTVPVGAPFVANPGKNANFLQYQNSIAMNGQGDSVVAWVNTATGNGVGDGFDIYAQRINAAGDRVGAAILVNSGVAGDQMDPSVAIDADGDFVVAWTTGGINNVPASVYARKFDATGAPQTGDIQVAASGGKADVAMDADGDFVVVWGFLNTFVRRFNSAGEAQGGEFRVGVQGPNAAQLDPTVAMDADGDFVVFWNYVADMYGQRYDAAGGAQGSFIKIGSTHPPYMTDPDVAMNASGEFVVSWSQGQTFGQPDEIFAKRFAANGVPEGTEFKVDQLHGSSGLSRLSRVAVAQSGAFLVTWNFGSGNQSSIYARGFDSNGIATDNPFAVTVSPPFWTVTAPGVALDSAGNSVIIWQASDFGLYADLVAQRFSTAPNVDGISVAPTAVLTTEGNAGTTNLVYTVSLSNAKAQSLEVLYETTDGSATVADSDYIPTSGTLTFAPGETTKLLTVQVSGDLKPETDEYFRLNLSTTSLDVLPDAVATVTIKNDDTPSVVASRQLFYNQSAFDGDDAAINSADDGAIATDKTAYLPGSGLATFANVSSYSRGINGIVVDLIGGVDHANISASDFVFKTGNNNAPGSWTELTVTPTVSVRVGAGAFGSDRVEITWAANRITNTWLEVQVLPTLQTGLTAADVFYWGSKVGDLGVATPGGVFLTSAADVTSVRYQFAADVSITAAGDFNRDGSVTAADATLALSNIGTIVRLQLGEPPVVATAAVDTTAVAVGLVASAGSNASALVSTFTTSASPAPLAKPGPAVAAVSQLSHASASVAESVLLDNTVTESLDLDDDLLDDVAAEWSRQ